MQESAASPLHQTDRRSGLLSPALCPVTNARQEQCSSLRPSAAREDLPQPSISLLTRGAEGATGRKILSQHTPSRHSRRRAIQLAAAGLGLPLLGSVALLPRRLALAAPEQLPEVQYDINSYLPPAENMDGTLF